MRFAGNTSNVGSYIQAGRAGAKGAADFFKVARANAPDYGGLAEANMNSRSAERIAATQAEAAVAKAGLEAKADVKTTRIRTEAEGKILDKKIDAKRKAGMVGMFGAAAGGLFMGMENKKAEKLQAERDAKDELRWQQRLEVMKQNTSVETPKTEPFTFRDAPDPYKPTAYKPGNSDSSGNSGNGTPLTPDQRSVSDSSGAKPGTVITQAQGKQLLMDQGMDEENATIGAAVMMAESSGKSDARSHPDLEAATGEMSIGLWQHNKNTGEDRHDFYGIKDWSELKDPATNARATYRLWKRAGGQWTDWGAYTDGGYKKFL